MLCGRWGIDMGSWGNVMTLRSVLVYTFSLHVRFSQTLGL